MNKLFLAFIIFYFVFNLITPVYAHETDIQAVESAASAALQTDSINIALNFERLGFLSRLIGISGIFFNSSFESTILLVIFFTFILIQMGVFKKFHPQLLVATRRVIILVLAISITVSFIPGILNLKPEEARAAVPAGVIVGWAGTAASIPAGWTRVTALDARFVRGAATGVGGGGTGGGATHGHPFPAHSHTGASHTHASSSPTGGALGFQATGSSIVFPAISGHTHSPTFNSAANPTSSNNSAPANYDATSLDPPNFVVIFIKSDGTPNGLPANSLAFFNGAAPTGWTTHAASADRFLKGAAAAGDGGATGGTSNAHTHTAAHTHASGGTHTHTISSGGPSANNGTISQSGSANSSVHTHTISDSGSADGGALTSSGINLNNGDARPPWKKLLPIQNTSGSDSLPNNVITMWDSTVAAIPSSWGRLTSVDGLFVNGAANSGEVGTTGGAATHTHAAGAGHTHLDTVHGTHTQTTTGFAEMYVFTADGGQGATGVGIHNHTAAGAASNNSAGTSGATTTAATANTSNDPTYTDVIYIQFQNATPNAPTIMGLSPIPGSKPNKDGGNISLQATATDPDVADTVQVEWDYSANSGGVWINIGTTTLGAQGTQTLSWNASGLTPGSTYRLRARTKDNGGAISGYTTQIADWTLTSGCSPPVGGDLIISVSCAFVETVDGVDNGNITINTSVTLTINASQTVAFNSAKSITVNGSIAVNSTGQIKQTNLWMVDADADGWPASTTQIAQDSSPGGTYRRRNLLQSQTIIDCNDAVLSSTNSC